MIVVKFFGPLAEITCTSELSFNGIESTDLLQQKLLNDFPELAKYKTLISVNKKFIRENQPLQAGDEIAFLPPFAGG